jgi:uncharacterized protein YndB with AHSA1/START domain
MRKTGESYTAARRQLLAKADPAPEPVNTELAGMSDEAVRAKTGRTWDGWVRALDALDAATWEHPEIARHLAEEQGLSSWWAQTVTVGYERIRGLRDIGQRRGGPHHGRYDANKSKTFSVPVARLYRACSDRRLRERWLPGVPWQVRTQIRDTSIRLTWQDDTRVYLYFTAKGDSKSQLAIQHGGLPDADAVARSKQFWGERLAALAELLAK